MNWKHAFLVSNNNAIYRSLSDIGASHLVGIVAWGDDPDDQQYALFAGPNGSPKLKFTGTKRELKSFLVENDIQGEWKATFPTAWMGMTIEEAIEKAQQ